MDKELIKLAFALGFEAAQNDTAEKKAAIKIPRAAKRYVELLSGGNKGLTAGYRDVLRAGIRDVQLGSGSKVEGIKDILSNMLRARKGQSIGDALKARNMLTPGVLARNASGTIASRAAVASELRKADIARVLTALGIGGGVTGVAASGGNDEED